MDHERDGEGDDRVDGVEVDGAADARPVRLELARLHERAMQVEVVRHHRRSDDADGDVDHAAFAQAGMGQSTTHLGEAGPGLGQDEDLDEIANGDGQDQHQDEGLCEAHAAGLKREQHQHVQRCDDDSPQERDAEEELDGDSAAEHLGQVAGRNGDLGAEPVGDARPGWKEVAAGLGEVLAGDDTEARRADLERDGHQAREGHDPEQAVFVAGAAGQVGGPVAGVHVADAHEQRRPGKREILAEEASALGNGHRAVHLVQRAPDMRLRRGNIGNGFCRIGHTHGSSERTTSGHSRYFDQSK